MFKNVPDKTVLTFKNRVPEESTKLITRLSVIKKHRALGIIIQLVGLLIPAAFILFAKEFKNLELGTNEKNAIVAGGLFLFLALVIGGGIFRILGRKYMSGHLDVWNKLNLKGQIEIALLENGLLIESSGRRYGLRVGYRQHRGGVGNMMEYYVFTELQVQYRKEEIPTIYEYMDKLEETLRNYGSFEPGRGSEPFYPLPPNNDFLRKKQSGSYCCGLSC